VQKVWNLSFISFCCFYFCSISFIWNGKNHSKIDFFSSVHIFFSLTSDVKSAQVGNKKVFFLLMQVWYNTFPFILNSNFTIFCIGFPKNCSSKVWGSILLEVIINRYACSENVVVKPHLLYLSLQFNIWLFFLLSELFSHPRTPTNKSSIQKLVTKILSFGVKISFTFTFVSCKSCFGFGIRFLSLDSN